MGQTSRGLSKRLGEHLRPHNLKKNTYKNHWIRQLAALGLAPVIELLDSSDEKATIDESEIFFIEYLRSIGCPLTNLAAGGEGIRRGSRFSAETRRKMSLAQRGKKRPKSDIHRERLRRSLTGKTASKETRAKMSLVRKGRLGKARAVEHLESGTVFRCGTDAARALGVSVPCVYKVANGQEKQAKGHRFRWTDRSPTSDTNTILAERN